MSALFDTVLATVQRHGLLPDGAPVLAMVSGGGDSVALLHLLARGDLGQRPLRVLHVNHELRAAESAGDEAFVRDLCASLGVDARVAALDVAELAASEGLNLEDAGRRVRYAFAESEADAFAADLAVEPSAVRIATAHSRDDRVETFFMRALAGAGAGALSSIAPARGRIVRPLIDCDRAEIRSWLVAEGVGWREDASNADMDRARAYVRSAIVPAAEGLNPSFRASLTRTLDLLRDDDNLLTEMAEAFARDFAETTEGEVRFERSWMATLDRTMARRTVRSALVRAFPEASRLEAHHVEAIVDGLADDAFARDLPEGLRAFTEYGSMVVSRTPVVEVRVAPCLLPSPGKVDLAGGGTLWLEAEKPSALEGDAFTVVIDAGRVEHELVVDSVRDGDRMRPLGMEGSRKLSDLLVDAKVPKRQRHAVPVVRDGDRIVWLAGVRMSDEYKVTEATTRAFRLRWEPGPNAGGTRATGDTGV